MGLVSLREPETFPTFRASVRSLSGVHPQVTLQAVLSAVTFPANGAQVRPRSRVRVEMAFQVCIEYKRSPALVAVEVLLAAVDRHVIFQQLRRAARSPADRAGVLSGMDALMGFHRFLRFEHLAAVGTRIRLLVALAMFLQLLFVRKVHSTLSADVRGYRSFWKLLLLLDQRPLMQLSFVCFHVSFEVSALSESSSAYEAFKGSFS